MTPRRLRSSWSAMLLLVLLVGGGAVALAGGLVAAIASGVDGTPAADQAAAEAAEVRVRQCRRTVSGLEAVLQVRNGSGEPSTYYLAVEFRRRRDGAPLTTGIGVVDAVAPDARGRTVIAVAADAGGPVDCVVTDVDRLAT